MQKANTTDVIHLTGGAWQATTHVCGEGVESLLQAVDVVRPVAQRDQAQSSFLDVCRLYQRVPQLPLTHRARHVHIQSRHPVSLPDVLASILFLDWMFDKFDIARRLAFAAARLTKFQVWILCSVYVVVFIVFVFRHWEVRRDLIF